MLAHGVIRTAHAVRSLAGAGTDDRAQRRELADGLGYWAARYWGDKPPAEARQERPRTPGPDPADQVFAAFDELIADAAGHYVQARHGHPVPLIHAITTPAAMNAPSWGSSLTRRSLSPARAAWAMEASPRSAASQAR